MIPPEIFENIFKTIAQPLSKLIKKGLFNESFQNISIAALLNDFAIKFPKDSLEKILSKGDYKKICSKTCHENFAEIKDIANSELRSANVVLKRIEPLRDCLHETEKEVYDLFCAYAKEYPRKSLSEIIQLDEVQEIHSGIYNQTKTKITKLNEVHLDKIEKLIKAENNQLDSNDILKNIRNINRAEGVQEYKFYQLTKYLENTLTGFSPKTIKKILAEAEKLQGPPVRADYFFIRAKKKKYNDLKILRQIITPSIATFEHIKPKSEGGFGSIDNGIVLCAECNSNRQSIPYAEFMQYNPKMPYSTQKQILQISDLILQNRIESRHKDYPIKIASTLYENSDGKINIDLTSYAKKASKKYSKDVKKRAEEITTAHKDLAKKKKQIEKMEQELKELYSKTYVLQDKISSKSEENTKDKALLKQINKLLKKK